MLHDGPLLAGGGRIFVAFATGLRFLGADIRCAKSLLCGVLSGTSALATSPVLSPRRAYPPRIRAKGSWDLGLSNLVPTFCRHLFEGNGSVLVRYELSGPVSWAALVPSMSPSA